MSHTKALLLLLAAGCSTHAADTGPGSGGMDGGSVSEAAGGSSANAGDGGRGGADAPRGGSPAHAGDGGRAGADAPRGGGPAPGGGGRGGSPADAAVGCERTCEKRKRGVAYDFCKGDGQGQADVELLRDSVTWFYNWGAAPGACVTGGIEYVPMVWGLTNGGSACEDGVCFNDGLSVQSLIRDIPASARYLLGFNEPNFAHQSNLTPTAAARAWKYLERVAEARNLQLVAPATNYCDPNPDSDHAGSCTREPAERVFDFEAYDLTVPAGHRYNAFEWAELFYDECTDCRIDYQAGHVYSYWGLAWYVDAFKRKAGLIEASEAHCKNGVKDADEFAADCGGNSCKACSASARAHFMKALWLTEFAPSTDDGPSPRPDRAALEARATAYIQSELPKLEGDAFVFRYAWFMPRSNIASLDHVDLLTDSQPPALTAAGSAFTSAGH